MVKDHEVAAYDTAEFLNSEERMAAYLELAFEEGDPVAIASALGAVARARGMTQLAEKTGVSREALYKSLSSKGNPRLSTLMPLMKALGLRLAVEPIRPV